MQYATSEEICVGLCTMVSFITFKSFVKPALSPLGKFLIFHPLATLNVLNMIRPAVSFKVSVYWREMLLWLLIEQQDQSTIWPSWICICLTFFLRKSWDCSNSLDTGARSWLHVVAPECPDEWTRYWGKTRATLRMNDDDELIPYHSFGNKRISLSKSNRTMLLAFPRILVYQALSKYPGSPQYISRNIFHRNPHFLTSLCFHNLEFWHCWYPAGGIELNLDIADTQQEESN